MEYFAQNLTGSGNMGLVTLINTSNVGSFWWFLTPVSLLQSYTEATSCMCPAVNSSFSDVATIDLRGANYSDWQLCLNEEEARRTAMETRWVGRGRDQAGMGATVLTSSFQGGATPLIGLSYW